MANMTVQNPDSIVFKLIMSMTLAEGRKLLDQLQSRNNESWTYPSSDLVEDLPSMIRQAETEFHAASQA